MFPLVFSNATTEKCPKKCNIAEAKDKDFKITIMNIFKDLKGMNLCENTNKQWNKMKQTLQGMNIEMESLKKT